MAAPADTVFQPKVIAAIDFGTHGSGYAWATVASLRDPESTRFISYQQITSYADAAYPKDLTAVLVDEAGLPIDFGYAARKRWARNRNPKKFGYATRFKMAIWSDAPNSNIPQFHGVLAGADQAAVRDLITASLRNIHEAALKTITGTGYAAEEIRWCLTVPAIWHDAEKAAMRAAAVRAGLPDDRERLLLVHEPEAAAVYCVATRGTELGPGRPNGRLDLDNLASFMVVDCGGGTVDITSYQVHPADAMTSRLKTIGIPDGGPMGSAYINHKFLRTVLADRFGSARLDELTRKFPKEIGDIEDEWEREKVSLDSETHEDVPVFTREINLAVPGPIWEALDQPGKDRLTALADGDGYLIVVTPAEITRLFDDIVTQILDTMDRHRRDTLDQHHIDRLDTIVIVGGFARSTYLRDRIEQKFGNTTRVLIAQDPAVAVLGGAIHFANDPSVIWTRLSKYTYGFECAMEFREGIDPEANIVYREDGAKRCLERFQVVVRRGDEVSIDTEIRTRTFVLKKDVEKVGIRVFATTQSDPDFVTDPGCRKIGTIEVDVSGSQGLPVNKRELDVVFQFGKTEFEVHATDVTSGSHNETRIEFDELLPPIALKEQDL